MYKSIFIILFSLIFVQELEVDGNLKIQGNLVFSDETSMSTSAKAIPTGVIMPYAGIEAPEGWALCAGQEISRIEFSILFNTIGELYGSGDEQTTFNLPDLRGRIPIGKDNMNNTSADRIVNEQADSLGGNAGSELHQLTVDEMPNHSHDVPYAGPGHWNCPGCQNDAFSYNDASATTNNIQTGNNAVHFTGGDQPHNNMPPYLTLNYIIKL